MAEALFVIDAFVSRERLESTLKTVGSLSAPLAIGNAKQAQLETSQFLEHLAMVQILWLYSEIRSVLPHVLQFLVSTQWLPHIKCVFASFSPSWVIAVVVDHSPENTVTISVLLLAVMCVDCRG